MVWFCEILGKELLYCSDSFLMDFPYKFEVCTQCNHSMPNFHPWSSFRLQDYKSRSAFCAEFTRHLGNLVAISSTSTSAMTKLVLECTVWLRAHRSQSGLANFHRHAEHASVPVIPFHLLLTPAGIEQFGKDGWWPQSNPTSFGNPLEKENQLHQSNSTSLLEKENQLQQSNEENQLLQRQIESLQKQVAELKEQLENESLDKQQQVVVLKDQLEREMLNHRSLEEARKEECQKAQEDIILSNDKVASLTSQLQEASSETTKLAEQNRRLTEDIHFQEVELCPKNIHFN